MIYRTMPIKWKSAPYFDGAGPFLNTPAAVSNKYYFCRPNKVFDGEFGWLWRKETPFKFPECPFVYAGMAWIPPFHGRGQQPGDKVQKFDKYVQGINGTDTTEIPPDECGGFIAFSVVLPFRKNIHLPEWDDKGIAEGPTEYYGFIDLIRDAMAVLLEPVVFNGETYRYAPSLLEMAPPTQLTYRYPGYATSMMPPSWFYKDERFEPRATRLWPRGWMWCQWKYADRGWTDPATRPQASSPWMAKGYYLNPPDDPCGAHFFNQGWGPFLNCVDGMTVEKYKNIPQGLYCNYVGGWIGAEPNSYYPGEYKGNTMAYFGGYVEDGKKVLILDNWQTVNLFYPGVEFELSDVARWGIECPYYGGQGWTPANLTYRAIAAVPPGFVEACYEIREVIV